jgi:hypothetical protein
MTMHSGQRVPLVLLEEHHEAFYTWDYAMDMGWLPQSGNTLLHVDAHADMMLPKLRRPLDSISSRADCADFIYHELDISTFIWPAIYNRLFSRLLWLKYNHRLSTGGWRSITLYSKNRTRTEFCITSALPQNTVIADPKAVTIDYCPVTTHDVLATDQPIVLDVDLDYFCSNDYPDLSDHEIEVTHETFVKFRSDPYHFLRISPLDKISAVSRAGKFYLVYNDYHPERPSTEENIRTIELRLNDFIGYLQRYHVVPKLILVCRSVHSGYTPRDTVSFLQRRLLRQLEDLYDLEQHRIKEILPGAGATPIEKEVFFPHLVERLRG